MNRFEGRTVLITGAARGQGASHARAFVDEGAKVILADIREEPGRSLADELGADAHFVKLDVARAADWAAAVDEGERRFGSISVLINNAGVLAPAAPIAESDPADWEQVIATNLTGTFLGIRAVAPSIVRAGGGSIVNIASTSSHVGTPLISPYVASKWGVRGLTLSAAVELARDQIRVNSVSPGVVNTKLITEPLRAGEVPVSDHFSPEPFAVRRMAEPEEITRLVLFLSSDQSAFITGSDYVIDGGMLLGPVPSNGQ
jgi:3alpha(or 20beta)-hydroxysteroid dehydrogenase